MTSNRQAFTLFEALLGLFIFGMILLMTLRLPVTGWQDQIRSRLFFDQLAQSLEGHQQVAINKRESQPVLFDAQRGLVAFPEEDLWLPTDWHLGASFIFTYLPNGRVTNFRTVTFFHEQGMVIKLVFQLGSGKFEFQTP